MQVFCLKIEKKIYDLFFYVGKKVFIYWKNMSNKLIKEKSPYLLQHSENPVDWFPWCDEAFERAVKENKPVFISIGYSTCHWCHVMEKESFEDKEIAKLMNNSFINIKVDREERPDIDSIYMSVCQMLTGSGGWPLTVITTPDRKPFFAGTYFPKTSKWGKIGMLELIPRINDLWKNRNELLVTSSEDITQKLNESNQQLSEPIDDLIFSKAFNDLSKSFDKVNGGFSLAPKFPMPGNLYLLMRYFSSNNSNDALKMVNLTLEKMRYGGIYDHLGYGFHRYSTDDLWLVPHFEKMLYDQAQLIELYLEAFQITKNQLFKKTAQEIIEYVQRDMTSLEGAFFSAEDADSDGVEGKFYLWTLEQIKEVLAEPELFVDSFNIKENGNFDEPTQINLHSNILHLRKPNFEIANEKSIDFDEFNIYLEDCRKALFNIREKRIRPHLDDKILTDWNGLMIASLAKASRILADDNYLHYAEKAFEFFEKKMIDNNGRLFHRFRDGEAAITGNLDDYAFFIFGLIELFQASQNVKYLKRSIELTEVLNKYFLDIENDGYFFTANDAEKLIARRKEIYDGALPSGNSIQLDNLLKLWKITGNSNYEEIATKLINGFSFNINQYPTAYSRFLSSLGFLKNDPIEIVFVEGENSYSFNDFEKILSEYFLPNKVVIKKSMEIAQINPFVENLSAIDSKSTIYFCHNFRCEKPINDLKAFQEF